MAAAFLTEQNDRSNRHASDAGDRPPFMERLNLLKAKTRRVKISCWNIERGLPERMGASRGFSYYDDMLCK
jgi:hypothetical protein